MPEDRKLEAMEKITSGLIQQLAALSPRSPSSECQRARRTAVNRALCPYRWLEFEKKLFRRFFGDPVEKRLDELYEKGFLNHPPEQRKILAGRIRSTVVERVRLEFHQRSGQMEEREADDLMRQIVDQQI